MVLFCSYEDNGNQELSNGSHAKPIIVTNDSAKEVIIDPDIMMNQFMKKDLEKVLDSTSRRERQVSIWRSGMEDERLKTFQEIKESVSLSRGRARQIKSCTLRNLKGKKKTKHLRQYLISYAS